MQQKKQQKQGKRQEWKEQMKESDRMLKGNVLLEKPQWVLMLTLAAEFLLLVVLHVLVNTFIRFCKGHLTDCFSWSCLTTFYPALAPVYIFLIIVAIAVAILNVYRFRNAFRSLEAGQKGTSRFTTMEEIKEKLRAFIQEKFEIDDDPDFTDDVHLFNEGFVDSFGAVEIIHFIEQTYNIEITQKDITLYPMNTIEEIAEVVENKLS